MQKLTTMKKLILLFLILASGFPINAQHSVARQWNEVLLESIRNDFARPTVHARNLFHTSAAMYDAWAAFEPNADTYFLGKTVNGFTIPYVQVPISGNKQAAQEEAMSYAMYRLILRRFRFAAFRFRVETFANELMEELGYDTSITSREYHCGPAQLGNYIADQIIAYGNQDGSNEILNYSNQYYEPLNPPLVMDEPGNPDILNLNRWQPLSLLEFIDQAGNPIGNNTPAFLSPEWGNVLPFAMTEAEATTHERDGNTYKVYYDPGAPAYLEYGQPTDLENPYKWGFSMVSVWSSHLSSEDTVVWDISPGSIGNVQNYPASIEDYDLFYDYYHGGDFSPGHLENPITNQPYAPNLVKRGDYGRVLAEFWADGPDSETPPGHWFTILNKVNDDPRFVRQYKGEGPIINDLEWDIKSYFMLGGAMHDAAIAAWGIKGWYDYIRPVSSIRGMAERGQGSDPNLPSYDSLGIPLVPDFIELIEAGDSLAGENGEHIGKVKLKAWRGPDYIEDEVVDTAGVGWIRAAEWWPYQRPSFVTPPFAGYVSGHSTYSRAAAEVMTALTGDPFFPGGMGEFVCPKNEFLVFEDGPSETVTLQWATYRDASDQCSLSRIWGGIHPPVDDMPGRFIGAQIGVAAFNHADEVFNRQSNETVTYEEGHVFPNPATNDCGINISFDYEGLLTAETYSIHGVLVDEQEVSFLNKVGLLNLDLRQTGIYVVVLRDSNGERVFEEKLMFNSAGRY